MVSILTPTQAFDLEVQKFKKTFVRSVRPVYGAESENKKPKAIGSCVLVSVGGKCFGVTAAHVTDELDSLSLHVAGTKGTRLVAIEGRIVSSPSIHLDFAFWELNANQVEQLGDVVFIDTEKESLPHRVPAVDRWNVALGFRASKNNKGINQPNNTIQPTLTSYAGIAESVPDLLQVKDYSDSANVFIPYQKFAIDGDGAKVNNPLPIGLSGGAIVDFGSAESTAPFVGHQKPVLAGIFTECHKDGRIAVGVRIYIVIDAIKEQMGL